MNCAGAEREFPAAARRYALLDRDGTVIVDKHYLSDPDQVELLPGAAAGLQRLQALGLGLVLISNQSGVGRGYFSLEAVYRVQQRLEELLDAAGVRLAGAYFCPHAPEADCACRKPRPGLAHQAAREWGFALPQAFVLGDKACDLALAAAVGAVPILVRTGCGRLEEARLRPLLVADDLAGAAGLIARWLEKERGEPPQG